MLDFLGVRLNLLVGQAVPLPPPATVMEALESAEVAISDSEPSGFSLVFKLGRSNTSAGAMPLLSLPALKAGSRLVLSGIIGVKQTVLIDGIIETADIAAGDNGGGGTLTLMGRDLTAVMDKEALPDTYPSMAAPDIAREILSRYASFGMIPDVRPPLASDRDAPTDRLPVQNKTDLAYLNELAAEFDHIFTIIPGPAPLTSRAYWGPKPRIGAVQKAISIEMGPASNASELKFDFSPAEAVRVEGNVTDETTGASVPVSTAAPLRPPLAARPSILDSATAGVQLLAPAAGQSASQALAKAQAESDASTDTLKVTGKLDLGRYGGVLEPRKLVGLRGAGLDHDGFYYVQDVVHSISRGTWSQAFTLTREGLGTTTMIVRP